MARVAKTKLRPNSHKIFEKAQVDGPQGLNDPLKYMEEQRRELFGRYSKASNGFSHRDVSYAATNLILNAVRQNCSTAKEAAEAWDEISTKAKENLLELHYFPSGQRRKVFPFSQSIHMPSVSVNKN